MERAVDFATSLADRLNLPLSVGEMLAALGLINRPRAELGAIGGGRAAASANRQTPDRRDPAPADTEFAGHRHRVLFDECRPCLIDRQCRRGAVHSRPDREETRRRGRRDRASERPRAGSRKPSELLRRGIGDRPPRTRPFSRPQRADDGSTAGATQYRSPGGARCDTRSRNASHACDRRVGGYGAIAHRS